MKKKLFLCGIILGMMLLAACSHDDDFKIDHVNIDAQIGGNGVMHVRELFTYTFDGSFNGMTRAIKSDVSHFKAYITNTDNPKTGTKNLKRLKTKYDDADDAYKIYTKSKNETKQVLYTYDVAGSVSKYEDIGDLTYAFFDEDNETDLHNVKVTMHMPQASGRDKMTSYLHSDTGKLKQTQDGITYTASLLESNKTNEIRLLFPASQLSAMKHTNHKQMKGKSTAQENDLQHRRQHLYKNIAQSGPVLWIMLFLVVLIGVLLRINHPNRYRGDKSSEKWQTLLEQADPLFVRYLDHYLSPDHESIIAALLSLKRRGIVRLEEVPSMVNSKENTFRFSLVDQNAKMDGAEWFLIGWLFTETDNQGNYFLLESLVLHEDDSDKVKKEKGEAFESNFLIWKALVKKRPAYQGLRRPYRGFSIFSITTTIVSFTTFFYFTKVDVLGPTAQWMVPSALGVVAVLAIFFNRNKWILPIYYGSLIIVSLIFFSMVGAEILAVVFLGVTLITLMINPSYIWRDDIKALFFAVKKSHHAFIKDTYPVGQNEEKIEKRLEYAIALNCGEDYSRLCQKAAVLPDDYLSSLPLLSNPILTTNAFQTSNLVFISSSGGSSTTGDSSSNGGGGAGAF